MVHSIRAQLWAVMDNELKNTEVRNTPPHGSLVLSGDWTSDAHTPLDPANPPVLKSSNLEHVGETCACAPGADPASSAHAKKSATRILQRSVRCGSS